MRNWNQAVLLGLQKTVEVFTVPMRNWNRWDNNIRKTKKDGFYSTYEELKPCLMIDSAQCPLSFYSTYEELKHINFLFCRTIVTCFYSTYEELKPAGWYLSCASKSCFYSTYEELKLMEITFSFICIQGFLQYLWGIETFYPILHSQTLYLVFTVPMRNWNYG